VDSGTPPIGTFGPARPRFPVSCSGWPGGRHDPYDVLTRVRAGKVTGAVGALVLAALTFALPDARPMGIAAPVLLLPRILRVVMGTLVASRRSPGTCPPGGICSDMQERAMIVGCRERAGLSPM